MPSEEKNIMKYVFLCGGTAGMVSLSSILTREVLAMYHKKNKDYVNYYYPTMDAGGPDLTKILNLMDADAELRFWDPKTRFAYVPLANQVWGQGNNSNKLTLKSIVDPWYSDNTLLTDEPLEFELDNGFGRNLILGAFLFSKAAEVTVKTDEDKETGITSIVDSVVNANGNYEVRVVFCGSITGGEGRTNLSLYPAVLRRKCVAQVMKDRNLQKDLAEEYVSTVLKIGVIMIGAAFRYPRLDGLDQDVSGLAAGTLRNYPKEDAAATDAFYLLEHDYMPVMADKASYGMDQFKHNHAIELVAYSMMEDFFSKTQKELDDLRNNKNDPTDKAVITSNYSLPGNIKTNWANLALPQDIRIGLENRLRFDAMLIYWLYPQLLVNQNPEALFDTEFACKMYGFKNPKKFRKEVARSELEDEIVNPFRTLFEREMIFLRWLRDIALTGRNWEQNVNADGAIQADLFPVDEIESLIALDSINQHGRMSGFNLDRLTKTEDGNSCYTNKTIDKVRSDLVYKNNGKRCSFMEIMDNLYDICAARKG